MLKFAVAGVALALGFAAAGTPAVAAPRNADCVDCPVSNRYDSDEVVQKIRDTNASIANEAPIDVRSGNSFSEPVRRPADKKRVSRSRHDDCADCAPRRTYDSREVVKKVRNIDRSRVINTRAVVPVRTRVRDINHLVVRKTEIRNVGVIQHNNIVVERETRYLRRIPVQTRVEFVTHNYRVVERPDSVVVPAAPRNTCSRGRIDRYGSCRPLLRVRG